LIPLLIFIFLTAAYPALSGAFLDLKIALAFAAFFIFSIIF
jgi:hypothetical protein